MADLEVYLDPSETGATVTADFILNGAVAVAAHPYVEQAVPGVFYASYPTLAAGTYARRVYVDGVVRLHATFNWDGAAEVGASLEADVALARDHARAANIQTKPSS